MLPPGIPRPAAAAGLDGRGAAVLSRPVPPKTLPPREIRQSFRLVGHALMQAGLNHTHSGNLSARDPADPSRFWITASGAPLGRLGPSDLVRVRLADLGVEAGGRPSSEARTHHAVLHRSGARACAHAHGLAGTLLGYEDPEKPRFLRPADPGREEHPGGRRFDPPDFWGLRLLGSVPVLSLKEGYGSSEEMVGEVSRALARSPLVLVAGHGPFCRGESLAACLRLLCVFEQSARISMLLARTGRPAALRPWPGGPSGGLAAEGCLPRPGPPSPAAGRFAGWAEALFVLGLAAFGTGSASVRASGGEMRLFPAASAPRGWEIVPVRRRLDEEPAGLDEALHRTVHTRTPYRACILAPSPGAVAAAAAAGEAPRGEILPVDDEARHAGVRLPIAPAEVLFAPPERSPLPRLLQEGGGCLLLEGLGILGCGRGRLAEAALRVSVAERVCRLRAEIACNHRLLGTPPPERFEGGPPAGVRSPGECGS